MAQREWKTWKSLNETHQSIRPPLSIDLSAMTHRRDLHEISHYPFIWNGGAERDRTVDLHNAIVALFQLSYGPILKGGRRIC